MTFEEAKKRKDYRFHIEEENELMNMVKNGNDNDEWGDDWLVMCVAGLDVGYVSLELNMGVDENGKFWLDYFVCLKEGEAEDDWVSEDYAEENVKVDFMASDWKCQLETDMFRVLNEQVERNAWSYDVPNKSKWKKEFKDDDVVKELLDGLRSCSGTYLNYFDIRNGSYDVYIISNEANGIISDEHLKKIDSVADEVIRKALNEFWSKEKVNGILELELENVYALEYGFMVLIKKWFN